MKPIHRVKHQTHRYIIIGYLKLNILKWFYVADTVRNCHRLHVLSILQQVYSVKSILCHLVDQRGGDIGPIHQLLYPDLHLETGPYCKPEED